MPFDSTDPRMQRCACGYIGTLPQVAAHRAHKVYAECLASPPDFIDNGAGDGADDDAEEDAGRADATQGGDGGSEDGAEDGGPRRRASAPPAPTAVPPTKTRGIAGRPDSGHILGFTPVRATYAFPAQMHALHDFFVGEGYEGTFQDWVTEVVLKCCSEHYRLRYGVYVERPEPSANGVQRG